MCCLENLSLPVLGSVMLVNSRQVGTPQENVQSNQLQLPAHAVLQRFDGDEDESLAAGSLQASLRSRPLPEVQRDVRPRTSLLSESNLNELLDKLDGREQLRGHVRKHI